MIIQVLETHDYTEPEYHSQFRFFFDRLFPSVLWCDSSSGGGDDTVVFSTCPSSRILIPPPTSPSPWVPSALATGLSDGCSILSCGPSAQPHAS